MLPPEKITSEFLRLLDFIEKPLKLPAGFIAALIKDDDWSFIIKCHALVEAGLSKTLSAVLDSRLSKIFQRLELGDSQSGKIVFAEALELVNSKQRKFIRYLSNMRNSLVHDVRNVAFRLPKYFDELDSNQRGSFLDAFTSFAPSPAAAASWRDFARKDPKIAIWTSTWSFLLQTISDADKAEIGRVRTRLLLHKAKDFDKIFAQLNKQK